ncbi:hypothetical protein OG689_10800 [Kitasatospora sp. NBC_00240]|uniref:hypothetical protein n=1 Tax=Kitasatospora sp. NBC_00240 TaxID=2903567 RepID=UPI00224EE74A|nr:hypothetical protein [Kitasatospora sp. NBC_00240]MCX5209772.1 hypothetical protein [Kitasatospora sp. NBC_00240]
MPDQTPAPTADPRQPAWDAVFAYIRTLPRDTPRLSVVERNAVIWRAVNAALVALGYPDAEAPAEQVGQVPETRAEVIAQALRDAAFSCDGNCDLEEHDCVEKHPIQVQSYHHDTDEIASVYGSVPALAIVAAAAMQAQLNAHRDQVLTEAAELLWYASVPQHQSDGVDAAADLLLAARTTQED